MIKSYANKVTSFLVDNNYVDSYKYEYDVYLYGFEILIASMINVITTLIIGLLFNKFIYSVIFLACYCPLRQFSGGYHANSYLKCCLTFVVIFIITIFIANNINNIDFRHILLIFSIFNFLSISILGPIEHINNPITDIERNKYKRNSKLISTIITIFITVSSGFKITYEFSIYSSLALFWINIMMVLAIIKNRRDII
ncbi:accessory gene regulator protein B [[Clostridium] sordellii]|uniref:accessory gene regulator ArgB-like protein n=1 Tax=Paraclostridium sordellii TaxID=1505 RepID=UPI0005E3B257|nr:accessory gene regulator B family protein [Paeniclostridium sordellii]CEN76367.1 accessory gene regulator protein B [[Clostridium] sordellii] [Paeniclostridium sordellii]